MNDYNKKGADFLAALQQLVADRQRSHCDSLFETLDKISMKGQRHLGLKMAGGAGMGDESAFYSFAGDKELTKTELMERAAQMDMAHLAKDLAVVPSKMGAWQLYLLTISPSLLPVFWHGGYIQRRYFFDLPNRKEYVDIEPMFEQAFWIRAKKIPEPTVELVNGKYIVKCAYWNDRQGLMLQTFKCVFLKNGRLKLYKPTSRTIIKYHSSACL